MVIAWGTPEFMLWDKLLNNLLWNALNNYPIHFLPWPVSLLETWNSEFSLVILVNLHRIIHNKYSLQPELEKKEENIPKVIIM